MRVSPPLASPAKPNPINSLTVLNAVFTLKCASFDADAVAKIAADAGLAALSGEKGSSYDALVYTAAIALWHLKKYETIKDAANKVRDVLDNGDALKHFNAAQ